MRQTFLPLEQFEKYYKTATKGKYDEYFPKFKNALYKEGISGVTYTNWVINNFESRSKNVKIHIMSSGVPEGISRGMITQFKRWLNAQ